MSQTVIEVIKRRFRPFCESKDRDGLLVKIREMVSRYGREPVSEATLELMQEFDWLLTYSIEMADEDTQRTFYGEAYDTIARQLEASGLKLEESLRVSDEGFALSCEAVRVIASTGFPHADQFGDGHESLKGIGISRDPFIHQLSESIENGEYFNSWMVASLTISTALEWFGEGDPEQAEAFLAECVSRVAPMVDLDRLLWRSRYDDRALMQLCSYVSNGFDAIARQQLEK